MGNRDSDYSGFERGLLLGMMLANGDAVDTATIQRIFGASKATSKRDIVALRELLPVQVVIHSNKRVELTLPELPASFEPATPKRGRVPKVSSTKASARKANRKSNRPANGTK